MAIHFALLKDDGKLFRLAATEAVKFWNSDTSISNCNVTLLVIYYVEDRTTCYIHHLKVRDNHIGKVQRAALVNLYQSLLIPQQLATPSFWSDPLLEFVFINGPNQSELLATIIKMVPAAANRPYSFSVGGPLLEAELTGEDYFVALERVDCELTTNSRRTQQFDYLLVEFNSDLAPLVEKALYQSGLKQLLEAAAHFESLEGIAKQDATARIVEFFVTCTFGYENRLHRFNYLAKTNSSIYRLFLDQATIIIKLESYGLVSLGRVNGFSAIMPLTDEGFRLYVQNRKPLGALTNTIGEPPEVIEAPPYHPSCRLAITGAVYFPSVPMMLESQRTEEDRFCPEPDGRYRLFPNNGGAFFRECFFPHLLQHLPTVDIQYSTSGPQAKLSSMPGSLSLPKILCPISGIGMGEGMLQRACFTPLLESPLDIYQNIKYILDLGKVNDPSVPISERQKIARLIERIQNQFPFSR